MDKRKVISVLAVVMVLIFGAITAFMLLNGDSEVKEKEVPKTSVNPTNSKVGKFGDSDSINTKKTTSVGSEEGKKSDDNSDIVSAIETEEEKPDKPAKVVTEELDENTDNVSVSTSNNNSVSVAVDNGNSDNDAVKSSDKEKEIKDVVKVADSLKQSKLTGKVKSIYDKYGVDVGATEHGGMFTLDDDVDHTYSVDNGNQFFIKNNGSSKNIAVGIEVVRKLGAPGSVDDYEVAIKKTLKSQDSVKVGKGFVRSDGTVIAIRW